MRHKRREIVFLASVDYGYERRNKGMRMGRPENSDFPYDRLEQELHTVIVSELPSDLRRIYGLNVESRVIEFQSGSVLVFFGAMISAVGFLSGYADFYESVNLIKQHTQLLIERLMRQRYGNDFDVSVVAKYPSLPDPEERFPGRRLRKMLGSEADEFLPVSAWVQGSPGQGPRRDGFFWFLLILNILLLGTVAILVWGAVVRTYFP
jgi:hypothetical protein